MYLYKKQHVLPALLAIITVMASFHLLYAADSDHNSSHVYLPTNSHPEKAAVNGLFRWSEDWDDDWDDDWDQNWDRREATKRYKSLVRYNRVEGLFIGAEFSRDYWRQNEPEKPFLFGHLGYSLSAKEFQYQAGFEKGFMSKSRLALGAEYHRMIDSPDKWFISDEENSIAAFLIKEDFQDFYLREGWSAYFNQNVTTALQWTLGWENEQFHSVEKNTNWSLFGGKKKFRENPEMSTGECKGLSLKVSYDSRNSVRETTQGWYVQLEAERAGGSYEGDYDFDRLLLDVRRYQPLGFGDGLDLRLRIGAAKGDVPWQRRFYLGGIGTLRGFRYKSLPDGYLSPGGDQMILGQIEYRIGSQDFPDEIGMGIFDFFNLILFTDIGWVNETEQSGSLFKGFKELHYSKLKNDVGIALASHSGHVRIEVARRTDRGYKPFTFYFRIFKTF